MTTREERSFCRFCIALCGIKVTVDGDTVKAVKGDPDHPGSRGYTCAKGRALGRWHHHPNRILEPTRRRGTNFERVSWEGVLAEVGDAVKRSISLHGPDSVGIYNGTAASLDGAGKWAAERLIQVLGSRSRYSAISVDNPCKPLVSLLMSGNAGLVPVVDDRNSTFTMFVGCNPVVSHGHLNGLPDPVVRLRDFTRGERELWIVDSRETESSRIATKSLCPRPGTDFAIFAFLVRELLAHGGSNEEYLSRHATPSDIQALREVLDEWTVERASDITGCTSEELGDLLQSIRRHGRVSVQTGTGATMAGAANLTEWLVWVLHIVTGSFDVKGGMWFNPGVLRQTHIDVHPNFNAPFSAPGPKSRPNLRLWGDEFPCSMMADEIESGNLKVLIVFGGNPLSAFPDARRTRQALAELDALVVVDVIDNEMTEIATHVLPAKGQLERADIPYFYDQFSLDYSTQFTPAVVDPVGSAKSMWWIAAHVAESVGVSMLPDGLSTASPDIDVLRYLASQSAAPFDNLVDDRYSVRPPVFGWVREKVLADGRWRLVPGEFRAQLARWRDLVPPPGPVLTSRRRLRHLNSQHPPMTNVEDDEIVLIHPNLANANGIAEGDSVTISTHSGSVTLRAMITDRVHRDVVSVTHGVRTTNVSELTSSTYVDELTGMVVQTALPVEIRRT